MISAAVVRSLRVPRDPPLGRLLGVALVAPDQRHDRHAGLEAGQAERELGEHQQRRRRPSRSGLPCCWSARRPSRRPAAGAAAIRTSAPPTTTSVQRQVDARPGRPRSRWPPGTARGTPRRAAGPARASAATSWPCSGRRPSGFSIRWAVASAAERVMVMMKSVAANPSRASTKQLALPAATAAAPASRSSPRRAGSPAPPAGRPAARRTASARRARAWRSARAGRPPGRRCRAGSRAWRSSRRRSGT